MAHHYIGIAALLALLAGCINDHNTSGGNGSQDTPLLWIDPDDVGGGGGGDGGDVPSSDTLVYDDTGCPLRTQTTDASVTTPESNLYYQITQYRQTLGSSIPGGIAVVPLSNDLREVERAHCKHMHHCILQGGGFLSTTNPEGDDAGARLDLNSISWITCGEIIEQGHASADEAFSAMETDPGKKSILDNANWVRVGCGYWPGTSPRWGVLFVM